MTCYQRFQMLINDDIMTYQLLSESTSLLQYQGITIMYASCTRSRNIVKPLK